MLLDSRLYGVRLGRIDASLKRLKEGRLHRFKQQKRAIEADRKRHLEIEGVWMPTGSAALSAYAYAGLCRGW